MTESTARAVPAGHSLLLWAARHAEDALRLRLVCAELTEPPLAASDEVVVAWRGCLADLPAALPFELLTLGVEAVVLDAVGCASDWPTEWDALAATAQVEGLVSVQFEPPEDARPARKLLDADAMPVLRRRSIFGLGASAEPDPELPDRQGSEQVRVRTVVRMLAGADPILPEPPEQGWRSGALDLVSDGCVSSRVCVRVCPEQALVLESAEDRAGLGYDPSLCTGCGLCLTVCDAQALSSGGRLGPPSLLAPPVLLELFDVRVCARCGAQFNGAGEHCAVCEYRIANPFGSRMPPGWRPPTS